MVLKDKLQFARPGGSVISAGDGTLDMEHPRVTRAGREVHLTQAQDSAPQRRVQQPFARAAGAAGAAGVWRRAPTRARDSARGVRAAEVAGLARRQVLTHPMILREVWSAASDGDPAVLRTAINQLGAKLEDDPDKPRLIRTEPRVGYRGLAPDGES